MNLRDEGSLISSMLVSENANSPIETKLESSLIKTSDNAKHSIKADDSIFLTDLLQNRFVNLKTVLNCV